MNKVNGIKNIEILDGGFLIKNIAKLMSKIYEVKNFEDKGIYLLQGTLDNLFEDFICRYKDFDFDINLLKFNNFQKCIGELNYKNIDKFLLIRILEKMMYIINELKVNYNYKFENWDSFNDQITLLIGYMENISGDNVIDKLKNKVENIL